MKFRNDINFLRALSVLVVMLFHFQVPFFGGGFIGVDVFFVISGFLMTMIILREFEKDIFTLKGFYERRIRRLVPALSLVLLFVLLISVLFFFQSDLRLNAKYVALADIFASNIYFWQYQNYFSSTDNILLHTWTLGVEWQFYLIYPLVLMALRKVYFNNVKLFWSILTFITLISLLGMLYIGKSSTNFIFYMLPTRYWELSIGGLAYGLGLYWNPKNLIKTSIVIFSIILIILSNLFISENNLWPSSLTLIPILATVAILTLNVEFSFFDHPIIRFFGNISYSLYLWHWPWYILFKYFGFISWPSIALVTLLSILSAYLSYKYIESNRKLSTVNFALGTTVMVGILSTLLFFKPEIAQNLSIYKSDKFKIGNYKNLYLESGQKEAQFNSLNCFITDGQTIKDYNKEDCLKCSESKKNILLMGDSHAAQFSASLRESTTYNILEASVGYTFPFLDTKGRVGTKPLMDYLFTDFMPNNKHKLDLVVVSVHWLMNKNSALNYTPIQVESEILQTINYLEKHKINYLIVGQSETYEIEYPKILMLENFGRKDEDFLNNTAKEFNNMLISLVEPNNFVDIYSDPQILRYDSINKIPYMFDTNHFSKFGADQVVKNLILPRIEEKLNRK